MSAAPPLSTTYAPRRPVSLSLTLRPLRRGHGDPTFRTEPSGVWRTLRAPTGGATLHLAREQHGICATAWGAGAAWAIEGVPELLGEGDDWDGLDVAAVPLLADSRHRNPGLRLPRTRQVFEMLIAAVLEQKVTGHQARQSWRVLLTKYGEPAPGPAPTGMRVFPDAAVWRRIPSWEWHRAGVGPDRAATCVRAAGVAADPRWSAPYAASSGSARGRAPRPRSVRTAIRMRRASATTICPRSSAGRCAASRSTTRACSSCSPRGRGSASG